MQGAAQLQNAEEYMNRRVAARRGVVRQVPGLFEVVEGASSPTLVWAFEGDVTLEELIVRRDFPECVEELLYGGAQGGATTPSRSEQGCQIRAEEPVHAGGSTRHWHRAQGRQAR